MTQQQHHRSRASECLEKPPRSAARCGRRSRRPAIANRQRAKKEAHVVVVRTQCGRSVFVQAPARVQWIMGMPDTSGDCSRASAPPDPALTAGPPCTCVQGPGKRNCATVCAVNNCRDARSCIVRDRRHWSEGHCDDRSATHTQGELPKKTKMETHCFCSHVAKSYVPVCDSNAELAVRFRTPLYRTSRSPLLRRFGTK